MNKFKEELIRGSLKIEVFLNEAMLELFYKHYQIMIKENSKYNLTSITEEIEAAEKHFIDSLMLYKEIEKYNYVYMVDIGSGAGFPGLPLKVYRTEKINLVLVDAVNKKVNFIKKVIAELNLENTKAIHARAEEMAVDYREKFDVAVTRAVGEIRLLAEYCLPLIKQGGIFIAAKGPNVKAELKKADKAIKILGGKIQTVREEKLPISGEGRTIVTIEKIRKTPPQYPRRPGIPKKDPL
ncbi:16S rRNA (guanine527-N7)-methyltransferase [Desulfotomaculum arcticum]|uniref:Ribosomal RNA small subunit methyltransferase G n=1 Tax=Desulfotruncus arcticus DSM 17038 TaxID=1121424 RepID=A0A1I2VQ02_9FIRM|nr:16S rRNA (guanine(527)-N(7))-methyltransferase RsmG [Desulfotruncus arcticus]SFG90377.1 16S rRNA (guanine527-N7)-methyltransferase [Desulfotomaculum arcticum] [Desulfotruncus arcticus DSM 17038]